jgi:small ligand-binding sensory domain FIST
MPPGLSTRSAGVAWSGDPDPRRAGLLAAAEAASLCGRESIRSVLVFASGSHATAAARVARGAADHLPDATVVVIGGGGLVTPDGESEGATAVTALTLSAELHVAVARGPKAAPDAESLGRMLGERIAHDRRRPALLFCQPRVFEPRMLAAFEAAARPQVLIGGGLAPDGRLGVIAPGRELETGVALAMRIDGGVRLAVGVSPGVRRLTPFLEVEEADAGFVTRLGGKRPLDVLTEAVQGRTDRPLVLAAFAPPGENEAPLVRAISGVNPARGAVHVGEEVHPGARMAFACLDGAAAREHLEATLRDVERSMAGGVPLAGVYVDCAGRGTRLYGRPGVDAKVLRARWPDLPFAGMHSSFEIAPFAGHACVHTFTGVLGLLYAPS